MTHWTKISQINWTQTFLKQKITLKFQSKLIVNWNTNYLDVQYLKRSQSIIWQSYEHVYWEFQHNESQTHTKLKNHHQHPEKEEKAGLERGKEI